MAVLAAAVVFSMYMKIVHQPISDKTAFYRTQIRKAEAQLKDLSGKTPSVTREEEKIQVLQEETDRLEEKISGLEKKLPSKSNTSQLIGEITRLARDTKLESVKQKISQEEGYSRIFLEIKFNASYIATIQYLSAVETISPFLRVEEMEISEPKGKEADAGGSVVHMVISCLLGEGLNDQALRAAEKTELVKVKRDILLSSAKPAPVLKESEFKLEGITYDAEKPTAIISGDVFRVNSEVCGFKIKKILADGIVLTDGAQDRLVNLKH